MTEREKVLYDVAKAIYAIDPDSPKSAFDAAQLFYNEMVKRGLALEELPKDYHRGVQTPGV